MTQQAEKRFHAAAKGYVFKDDKVLVLYKSEEEARTSVAIEPHIDTPGGSLEYGEDFEAGLLREVDEETGLDVRIVAPFNTWGYTRPTSQLVGVDFLCEWVSGEVVLSHEHIDFEWLTLPEIRKRGWYREETYALAFRLIELYRQGL